MASRFESSHITKPTLLLDRARALRNIEKMTEKARTAAVAFRPHFKTHQSLEIGRWFRDAGVGAITVSSVRMAEYFAADGWSDITVAFPFNLREVAAVNNLAQFIRLGILIDSGFAVAALAETLDAPVRLWIKIDTGYGRVGVPWEHAEFVARLAQGVSRIPHLQFEGILTHSGHSYRAGSAEEILRIHARALSRMAKVRKVLLDTGVPGCKISVGDTPTCTLAEEFPEVDEIRPGNFVFYDVLQRALGVCRDDEIAVAVACPIVGRYEDRNEIAVYGGAAHLSTEHIVDEHGHRVYGYLASADDRSLGRLLPDAPVVSLSQEHGIVRVNRELLGRLEIGEVVCILPVHSCLTCNLHRQYQTLEGETVERM